MPLVQKIVVFHTAVSVQLLQPVLPRDTPVDKNKVACLQNVGQAQEEGTFPGKMLQHRPAQAGQVVHAFHFQAQLRPHLSDEPPLPPKLKHRPQLLVRPGPPLQKHPVNMVTIAT